MSKIIMDWSETLILWGWWFAVIGGTTVALLPELENPKDKQGILFCSMRSIIAVLFFPLPLIFAIFRDSWVPKEASQVAGAFRLRILSALIMPICLPLATFTMDKEILWILLVFVAFFGNVYIWSTIIKILA